jgi:peptidylprolyl isomerase
MSLAQCGDTVKVHITVWLEDGTDFVRSRDTDPFEFTLGQGEVMPNFENAVIGMEVGETKTITLPPDDAYGERHEDLLVSVKKRDFPESISPVVGERLRVRLKGSDPIEVTVMDINEDTIILDGNHPLAGYSVTYNIQLVAIK